MLLRRAAPPPDPECLRLDPPGAEVRLRRSARARRFTLSIGRGDGRPVLTLPERASLAEAQDFLERHAGWLEGALSRLPPLRVVAAGRALPFRGGSVVLEACGGPRRAPSIAQGALRVWGPPEAAPGRALAFLKMQAREALAPAAQGYAEQVGRKVTRISLRDTRSRWGSCTSAGALSFSWRLIMAPPEVLDYVAAHEAAHLVEMNHGPRFWALVATLRPDWKESRDWLRRHGGDLQRVDFGS